MTLGFWQLVGARLINLKLWFASFWMPKSRILKELKRVYLETNNALDLLLKKNSLENPLNLADVNLTNISIGELRRKMASDHNVKVSTLVSGLGRKKAVSQARKELLNSGIRLGKKARLELGVGDSISDILRAAKIMYRVLGIDFEIMRLVDNEVLMFVNRCCLSEVYDDITCEVLSAADEGVVQGLNSNFEMTFEERITSGAKKCKAQIKIKGAGRSK